jgi:hypothetical protein
VFEREAGEVGRIIMICFAKPAHRDMRLAIAIPFQSSVSTPEEKCIDFPEQKYISEAGKKGR